MSETWKPVSGDQPGYEVSNLGRVRSLSRTIVERGGRERKIPGTVLTPFRLSKGYLGVTIGGRTKKVHRLVAAAFIGNAPGKQVRHLDGNPHNNCVENLEYGTNSENQRDSVRHGTHHIARKTHCWRGNELSGENLRITDAGDRVCRECKRISQRKIRESHPMTRQEMDRVNTSRRKPCRGCGGPKGPGKRRVYCDACQARRGA